MIEYLGEQDDVRPFIAKSHVLVLPSYREGMPRTVLEAASMGRPAIVTDVPGCRQAVVNGETGWSPATASRRSSTSAWWCGRRWIASRAPARKVPQTCVRLGLHPFPFWLTDAGSLALYTVHKISIRR